MKIEDNKPKIKKVEKSMGSFQSSTVTYNDPTVTYNDPTVYYGGFYGQSAVGVIPSIKVESSHIKGLIDYVPSMKYSDIKPKFHGKVSE